MAALARRTPVGTLRGLPYCWAYWLPSVVLGWLARAFVRRRRQDDPRALAVLIPEHIGDGVFTVPLLRALRRRFPAARLIVAVDPRVAPLFETCPFVDEIVAWRPPALREALRVGRVLRSHHVDIAIVPRADPSGAGVALAAVVSGAPRRIGLSDVADLARRIARLQAAPFFTELVLPGATAIHEHDRRLAIARHLGTHAPDRHAETWITPADEARAAALFNGLPPESLAVAFGIGASAANRKWPVDRFIAVIVELARRVPLAPILIGGREDEPDFRRIRAASPINVYALPGATLRESIALLCRCVLFVGNDSGPAHLAAANGVPTIVVSAHPCTATDTRHPSHPAKCGPTGPHACVLRPSLPLAPECARGCVAEAPHCILGVSVEAVLTEAEQVCHLSPEFRNPTAGTEGTEL